MKVNPLLLPYFLEMNGDAATQLKQGTQRTFNCYWGRIQTEIVNGQLEPRVIEEQYFHKGALFGKTKTFNEKMKALLIGKPIDHIFEAPLFHRTRITKIKGDEADFETKDPYVPHPDLPIHSMDSHRARMTRKSVELLLCSKIDWMTLEILHRLDAKQIGECFEYLKEGYSGSIHWREIDPKEPIKRVELDGRGMVKNIIYDNMEIRNGMISLQSPLPLTVAQSIIGEKATKVADHWILEKARIGNAIPLKNVTRISIKGEGDPRKSYMEEEPARAAEIIGYWRDKERFATSDLIKDWDKQILEWDADRGADTKGHLETIHFFRTFSSKNRDNKIRMISQKGGFIPFSGR